MTTANEPHPEEQIRVWLVEDDVYGDLAFEARRPPPVKGRRAQRMSRLSSRR